MCHALGGKVEAGLKREFGHATLDMRSDVALEGSADGKRARGRSSLFKDIMPDGPLPVWMSHGDKVTELPDGFVSIATTSNPEHAAVHDAKRKLFGVQFHPEVTHTPSGSQLIRNF